MLLTAAPLTAYADTEEDYYKNLYFQGLADPLYTKTVGNSPVGIGPSKKATYKIKKDTYKVK